MSKKTTTKKDLYQEITDRIVAYLEKGVKPWEKPWHAASKHGHVSRPLRYNGEPYQGVNVINLWMSAMEQGFSTPIWMTYKQAESLGGQVRKGEKGSLSVRAGTFLKTEQDRNGDEVEKTLRFLKRFAVFNVDQIDGLPDKYYATPDELVPLSEDERIDRVDQFFKNTGASIQHGGASAFYSPTHDFINMPPFERFFNRESYYATLAHETTHWTRHKSRLNRDLGRKSWGDAGYAMEELVAELGAAFLCADLAITLEPRDDHADYIGAWLEVLKKDTRAVFTAASHATKAVTYLHELQPGSEVSARAAA
jgi:antirestriction protein ArdC